MRGARDPAREDPARASAVDEAVVAGSLASSDRDVLHQFGYAQQLLRDMGGFSNFAISFSVISILTGAITLYGAGLSAGGPIVMGIGWPLVTLFVLVISACMAELASAIPTSGALYHWSALLGGAGWGWLTAWLNLVGLVAAITGIDYGCAQFLAPLVGLPADFGHTMALFGGLLLSQAVLNHTGIRIVARLNDISALYHIGGVLVVVLALAFFAPKHPVSYLFTATYADPTVHKAFWFLFLTGLLQAQWTYTGYDASAHTIEETRDARVRAPWGIFLSVAISGLAGYVMLAFITLAIRDLPGAAKADNPIRFILGGALGERFGTAIVWVMTLAMWFCGLACVTSTSRLIFAFSRDRGLPLHATWSSVSRRFRSPAAAVWLAAAFAYLLPLAVRLLVALDKALDYDRLYTAVTGVSTIALYLAYGAPILLKLLARRRGAWTHRTDGPWNLGRWSVPAAWISLAWIAFITVLFVLPPNQLTGVMSGITLICLGALYLVTARGRFVGPVPQARSEEELRQMEEQLES